MDATEKDVPAILFLFAWLTPDIEGSTKIDEENDVITLSNMSGDSKVGGLDVCMDDALFMY
jgi:hypothetical protein